MKKPTSKKLKLHRETIRSLTARDLSQAAGGAWILSGSPSCANATCVPATLAASCNCTK